METLTFELNAYCTNYNTFEDFTPVDDLDGNSLLNDSYFNVKILAYCIEDFDLESLETYNLRSCTKKNLIYDIKERFNLSDRELSEISLDYYDKYFYQLTKRELIAIVEIYDSYSYIEFLALNFELKYDVIASRGYCQGDYYEVICPKGTNQKDIDHALWDSLANIQLCIDDNVYYLEEFLDDFYVYDKDELLTNMTEKFNHTNKKEIIAYLSEALPEELDYIG